MEERDRHGAPAGERAYRPKARIQICAGAGRALRRPAGEGGRARRRRNQTRTQSEHGRLHNRYIGATSSRTVEKGTVMIAAAGGPRVCNAYIRGRRTGLCANGLYPVRSDCAAPILRRHPAKCLDAHSLSRGAAAARLHALASSVAGAVDGAEESDERGFGLATIGAAAAGGCSAPLWRRARAPGAPGARFCISAAGRSAGRRRYGGNGGGAHG